MHTLRMTWLVKMSALATKICEYIRNYQNLESSVLPEHSLSKDLHIDGQQGLYFIIDFGKQFNTDFSEMEITRHFDCKYSVSVLSWVGEFLNEIMRPKNKELIDIKVKHLILAAENKVWSDKLLNQ